MLQLHQAGAFIEPGEKLIDTAVFFDLAFSHFKGVLVGPGVAVTIT